MVSLCNSLLLSARRQHFLLIFLVYCCAPGKSLQNILVTGAGGRTGQWVVQELLDNPQFTPTAVVRNERSANRLRKRLPRLGLDQIVVCDVMQLVQLQCNNTDSSTAATPPPSLVPNTNIPYDALVICTSSVPVLSQRSFWKALVRAPWNRITKSSWLDYRQLQFRWKYQQTPEQIDYYGQVAQIDWAQRHETCQCVVLVSSMGGTNPDNFLNSVGRRKDGTGGDILQWKRRAELYLADKSGMDSFILHPGGLNDNTVDDTNVPEEEGQETQKGSHFCLGVDDELYGAGGIARRDVAQLCVAALKLYQPGQRIAMDCITHPSSRKRTAEAALEDFRQSGEVYNYISSSTATTGQQVQEQARK